MKGLLVGVIVGAAGAMWLSQARGRVDLDRQFGQMQERANAILLESRRILEETRRELSSALESGRQTVQQRTDRVHGTSVTDAGTIETGEPAPPTV